MGTQTNDPQTWLTDHGDYLYRYAMSRLHDSELAADMLQETLLAAWKGHKSFSGDSSVRTWLVGILKHKIIDHIRKEIRERKLSEAVESDPTTAMFNVDGSWVDAPQAWKENPEDLAENEQFRKILHDCIDRLPDKQRTVFTMRELAGDDTDTICNEAEITPTNLHVMIHRARLALRKCLEFKWFGMARNGGAETS